MDAQLSKPHIDPIPSTITSKIGPPSKSLELSQLSEGLWDIPGIFEVYFTMIFVIVEAPGL